MHLKKWVYFTFINLLIVACLGLILRYKITFSLPIVNQKFLQHGHSHFALTGWVSQLLMVLSAFLVSKKIGTGHFRKYQWILWLNLVSAFGMLFSFPFQGYGSISIAFSALAILTSFFFAGRLWWDMSKVHIRQPAFKWFKAALLFSILSAVGVFVMIYLMVSRNNNPNDHLAAIYLFLHFQYNGWFVFSCFGLLEDKLQTVSSPSKWKLFFWVNALACLPAYVLSAPWVAVPFLVRPLAVLAGVAVFVAWIWLALSHRREVLLFFKKQSKIARILLGLSAIAYTLKVTLQMGSAVPALSKIAFGFRPIVVGYLHLVFLGVISLFLFGYVLGWVLPPLKGLARKGLTLFVSGIVLSEAALMIQGAFAIGYHVVPFINEIIFAVTVLMVLGMFLFVGGLLQQAKELRANGMS